MISENIWIVVKNTPNKTDPRAAILDFVAIVQNASKFDDMLKKNNMYAYRARSYGKFFPNFEQAITRHI